MPSARKDVVAESGRAGLLPAAHLRWIVLEGKCIFLDLRAGTYVMLDEAASAAWQRLAAPPHAGAAFAPTDEAFREDCVRRGYLEVRESAPPSRSRALGPPRVPLFIYALYALIATSRSLARGGFASLYLRYAGLTSRAQRADSAARLARAERAIALAENFFTGSRAPDDCLPRSLAVYRVLKCAGLRPEHCIGVKLHPFEAHAWVECGGRVVRDTELYVREFAVIARLA